MEDNGPVQQETEWPVVEGDLPEDATVIVSGFADDRSDVEEHIHGHISGLALG